MTWTGPAVVLVRAVAHWPIGAAGPARRQARPQRADLPARQLGQAAQTENPAEPWEPYYALRIAGTSSHQAGDAAKRNQAGRRAVSKGTPRCRPPRQACRAPRHTAACLHSADV